MFLDGNSRTTNRVSTTRQDKTLELLAQAEASLQMISPDISIDGVSPPAGHEPGANQLDPDFSNVETAN